MAHKSDPKLTISLANLKISKHTLDQLIKIYITKRINRELMVKPVTSIKRIHSSYIVKKKSPKRMMDAATSAFKKSDTSGKVSDSPDNKLTNRKSAGVTVISKSLVANSKITNVKKGETNIASSTKLLNEEKSNHTVISKKEKSIRETQIETELVNILGHNFSKYHANPLKIAASIDTDDLERMFETANIRSNSQSVAFHPLQIWMSQPAEITDCPRGLEYLNELDHMQIHKIQYKDRFMTHTYFMVENEIGQYVYKINLHLKCIHKFMCTTCKRFDLFVYDSNEYPVMIFSELKVIGPNRSANIFAPVDTYLGRICEKDGDPPSYVILDTENEILLEIHVEAAPPKSKFTFGITSSGGKNYIGKIVQEYSHLMKKVYNHTEYLTIYYFSKVDPKTKALILGASFLLGFVYFEMFYVNR